MESGWDDGAGRQRAKGKRYREAKGRRSEALV